MRIRCRVLPWLLDHCAFVPPYPPVRRLQQARIALRWILFRPFRCERRTAQGEYTGIYSYRVSASRTDFLRTFLI